MAVVEAVNGVGAALVARPAPGGNKGRRLCRGNKVDKDNDPGPVRGATRCKGVVLFCCWPREGLWAEFEVFSRAVGVVDNAFKEGAVGVRRLLN
jgi:hypothetical protein